MRVYVTFPLIWLICILADERCDRMKSNEPSTVGIDREGRILMQEAAVSPLATWQNFYVIIGSASATLTGLMFVVITLTARYGASGVVE